MKLQEIKNKLELGYKFEVWLKPCSKHEKMLLKIWLINRENPNEPYVYELYEKHVKNFLTEKQLHYIDLYKDLKNIQFNKRVDINIEAKRNPHNLANMEKYTMLQCIGKLESVELI